MVASQFSYCLFKGLLRQNCKNLYILFGKLKIVVYFLIEKQYNNIMDKNVRSR